MQNEFSNQCSNKVLNLCKMLLILVKSFKNKVFLKLVTGLTAKLAKVYAKSAKFFLISQSRWLSGAEAQSFLFRADLVDLADFLRCEFLGKEQSLKT